jgi:O-antigen/teichoic acid export membrane protein
MKNDSNTINSSRQIKLGAIMSYVAIFFNIIAGIIYTPWMIHQIGESNYGLYTLAITLISFFTIDFGLGQAVSRFLSKYNVEMDERKKRDFLGITFKIYLILDLFIFLTLVLAYLFVDIIYAELTIAELEKFRIIFIIAALYAVGSFPFNPLNGILISYERFSFLKLVGLIHKVMTVITMVIVLILGYGLYLLVLVNAITGIATIIMKLRYIYINQLISINFKAKDKGLTKEIFTFSSWTAIIAVSQRFIFNITPTVLAAFAGSIQISLFSIASTIEGFVWTFAAALNGLFLPKVTKMIIKNKDSKDIELLMVKVGRIQLFIVGLLFVGFLTMGKEFLVLWIGDRFIEAYYIVILLIAPSIISLTQQIGDTALVAKNEIKYRAFSSLLVATISFILSIILSQYFGALGSGFAIFIGNIFGSLILMNIVYNKVLGINIYYFLKECHLKMLIPLAITTFIGVLIQYLYPVENIMLFLVKITILSLTYMLLMWKLSFNEFEKNIFMGLAKRIQQRFKVS